MYWIHSSSQSLLAPLQGETFDSTKYTTIIIPRSLSYRAPRLQKISRMPKRCLNHFILRKPWAVTASLLLGKSHPSPKTWLHFSPRDSVAGGGRAGSAAETRPQSFPVISSALGPSSGRFMSSQESRLGVISPSPLFMALQKGIGRLSPAGYRDKLALFDTCKYFSPPWHSSMCCSGCSRQHRRHPAPGSSTWRGGDANQKLAKSLHPLPDSYPFFTTPLSSPPGRFLLSIHCLTPLPCSRLP